MASISLHGISSVACKLWDKHVAVDYSYGTVKITEESGSNLDIFVNSVGEIDMLIDHLQTLRQELAAAQCKEQGRENTGTDGY